MHRGGTKTATAAKTKVTESHGELDAAMPGKNTIVINYCCQGYCYKLSHLSSLGSPHTKESVRLSTESEADSERLSLVD